MTAPLEKPAPSHDSPIADLSGELIEMHSLERSKSSTSRVRKVFRELSALGVATCGDFAGFEGIKLLSLYRRSLESKGLSRATQRTKFTTLKGCLRYGVRRGYLTGNPFDAWEVRLTGPKPKDRRYLTLDEIAAVLDGLEREACEGWREHELYAVVSTVAYAGLRSTEALRLRHEDIDLEARTISIVRRTSLKTEASERKIPIPDALADVLRAWLPISGIDYGTGRPEWVFPHSKHDGPWLHGSDLTKPLNCFRRAADRFGVPGATFLRLRHSWATLATMCWGLSIAQVSKMMGHTRISTTYENYVESDVEAMRTHVDVIRFPTVRERRGEVKIGGQAL